MLYRPKPACAFAGSLAEAQGETRRLINRREGTQCYSRELYTWLPRDGEMSSEFAIFGAPGAPQGTSPGRPVMPAVPVAAGDGCDLPDGQ